MASPFLDGAAITGIASGASSKALAISTSVVNTVLVLAIGYELGAAQRDVTGVVSTSGLSWARRAKISNAGQSHETVEIWWAPCPAIVTAENVTASWDANFDDAALALFAVQGCGDISSPWDINTGLPASSISGASPTVNFDTDEADDLLLGFSGVVDNLTYAGPPSGWTNIAAPKNAGGGLAQTTVVDIKSVSAAQVAASYKPGHSDQGVVIVDALTADGGSSSSGGAESSGRVTQAARLTVGGGGTPAPGRASQAVRLAVAAVEPPGRVTQAARLLVCQGRYPARITQGVRLVVGQGVACVTHWQQCWRITRRDGTVLRFTSLDANFAWGLETFLSCGSLSPSAAEESSEIGSVSNMELKGILAHDSITEADLYGGLYDDAFVEIWLVPYEGAESPRRLAAGWIGAIQHGEQGWTGEITGPGARLDQQALVVPYAPACRWTFGDARCTKDLTPLQTTGEVSSAANRGSIVTTAEDPGNGSQWENGRVIWTSGRNLGQICEVKTVAFESGGSAIELWALTAFLPEPGDTFTLQPGCDLSAATCKNVYSNLINFGGFKDVPGNDSLAETPLAKIDS